MIFEILLPRSVQTPNSDKNWQTSCPLQTFVCNISRHLEFIVEHGHRVNWVSGSLDSRVTGSLGHKMWPSSMSAPDTTQTGLFCRVWCGGVNRVGSTARQDRLAWWTVWIGHYLQCSHKERNCAENYNKWRNKFFFLNCNQHFSNFEP